MDFALTTGDNADNQQYNENVWVRQLLEGGSSLSPNSGVRTSYNECSSISDAALTLRDFFGAPAEPIYTGVQDFGDQTVDTSTFYDPNAPRGTYAEWPRYSGLMNRAQLSFTPTGVRRGATSVPSYVANGNHDGLVQGNQASNSTLEGIALGCIKPVVPSFEFGSILESLTFFVRPDANRRHVDKAQLKAVYRAGSQADGHGFGLVEAAQNTASSGAASYYAWDPKPGVRFIALDTVSEGGLIAVSADGNLDDPQYRWLTNEINAAEAARKVVVVFGHHPIRSLTANLSDESAPACTRTTATAMTGTRAATATRASRRRSPRRGRAEPVQHARQRGRVRDRPHAREQSDGLRRDRRLPGRRQLVGGQHRSEVDWPQESRLIEVMDNADGTLSVFGTLLDHAATYEVPAAGSASGFNVDQLSAISRTLSYNDPQAVLGRTAPRRTATSSCSSETLADRSRSPARMVARASGWSVERSCAGVRLGCEPTAARRSDRMPTDEQIREQIDALEQERLTLREREGERDPTQDSDVARLEEIRVELDRLWDFLRQRTALREAGRDPDEASERAADVVEKYWQ